MCTHEQELDRFEGDHTTSLTRSAGAASLCSRLSPVRQQLPQLLFDQQESIVPPGPNPTGFEPQSEITDTDLITAGVSQTSPKTIIKPCQPQ